MTELIDKRIFNDAQVFETSDIKLGSSKDQILWHCAELDQKLYGEYGDSENEDLKDKELTQMKDDALYLVQIDFESILAQALLRFYQAKGYSTFPEIAKHKGWYVYGGSLWLTKGTLSIDETIFSSYTEIDNFIDFCNHTTEEELIVELEYSQVDLTTLKVLYDHDLQYQERIALLFRELAAKACGYDRLDQFDQYISKIVGNRTLDEKEELNLYLSKLGYGKNLDNPNLYVLPMTSRVRMKFDDVKIQMTYSDSIIDNEKVATSASSTVTNDVLLILTNDTPLEVVKKLN